MIFGRKKYIRRLDRKKKKNQTKVYKAPKDIVENCDRFQDFN